MVLFWLRQFEKHWTHIKIHTLKNKRASVIQMETWLPKKSFDFRGSDDWTNFFGKLYSSSSPLASYCLLPLRRCRHALETEWRRGGATSFFSFRRLSSRRGGGEWGSRVDASTRGFDLTLADGRLKIARGRPKGKTADVQVKSGWLRWGTGGGRGGRGEGGRGADNQRNRREDLERPRGWVGWGAFSRTPPSAVPTHYNPSPPPDLYHQSRYNFNVPRASGTGLLSRNVKWTSKHSWYQIV